MALPFDDGSFDIVSIAFGIRNITDAQAALEEFRRVLRGGGRLLILEFSRVENRLLRAVIGLYCDRSLSVPAEIGGDVHRSQADGQDDGGGGLHIDQRAPDELRHLLRLPGPGRRLSSAAPRRVYRSLPSFPEQANGLGGSLMQWPGVRYAREAEVSANIESRAAQTR